MFIYFFNNIHQLSNPAKIMIILPKKKITPNVVLRTIMKIVIKSVSPEAIFTTETVKSRIAKSNTDNPPRNNF